MAADSGAVTGLSALGANEGEKSSSALTGSQPDMSGAKKVLIIGAGFGGLGCAHALSKSNTSSKLEVTIVDSKDYFSIGGTWQYVWTNRLKVEETMWPLANVSLPGVRVRAGMAVKSLDLDKRVALLADDSQAPYDYLVMAPGVVSDGSKIPGLSEMGVDVCSIDHAERAKSELQDFINKAKAGGEAKPVLLVSIGAVPYKCPPLPFEVAALVDHELRAAGVREKARIVISCPVPFPMGGPPPNPASEAFLPLMADKGVEWLPDHVLTKVDKSSEKMKVSFANGVELEADTIFAIYPQRAPDLFVAAGLTNAKGLIPADLQTNRLQGKGESGNNVFVLGDACHMMMPKPNLPHPKAGEFAWQMGEAVAANICASMEGAVDPLPLYRGGRCIAETGGASGVDMVNDLTNVISNPAEGKPSIKCTPGEGVSHMKLEWVNSYIERLYGADARKLVL